MTFDKNMDRPNKIARLQEKDSDNELLEMKVTVPDDESTAFSFRKLWAFTGPGFLMSIAFLDPGNIEADLQSGAAARYQLFWVLFWSTVLGLMVQRLSARVGTVTGQHLAEVAYTEYRSVPRILVWLMMEVAIIGSDMQEVVGTAISLYLLSDGWLPLYAGVLVTILDTLTFLFLDKYGLRKLELFFAVLITVMAVTFGYEFFKEEPSAWEIVKGTAIPNTKWNSVLLLQSVGIIGACIMPHNLYLHSGLVKTRAVDRNKSSKISEANFYFFVESALALAVSFIINLFVMSVFAEGLNGKTNREVYDQCAAAHNPYTNDSFKPNDDPVDVHIYQAGVYLGCEFGMPALYIWAVGILAAGQSSTMTGCYAGQFVMEGFLNLNWVRWKRVLFTRCIAIIPSFLVAFFASMSQFSDMNDLLNALMSVQLPFAVLPAIAFSSNTRIMGEFANGLCNKFIALFTYFLIFGANTILLYDYLVHQIKNNWILGGLIVYFIIYILLCTYLSLHCLAALFSPDSFINRSKFMRKYILGQSIAEYYGDQRTSGGCRYGSVDTNGGMGPSTSAIANSYLHDYEEISYDEYTPIYVR